MKFRITILLLLFSFSTGFAQVYQEYLLSGWTFKSTGSANWLPAEVPGSVESDLVLNGRMQPIKLEGEWEYKTSFIVDEFILARDHIELIFQGLDTQADVYINDQLILQANNMFRTWEIPVKFLLIKGTNDLRITFKSPGHTIDPSLRKAVYHFEGNLDSLGIPIGISKPVILQSWNTYKLAGFFIQQKSLDDREALLNAIIDVKGDPNTTFELEIYNEITNRTYKKQRLTLTNEKEQLIIPFTIKKPKLWWPTSLGNQDLYIIGVRIKRDNNEQILTKRIGLREVEINGRDTLSVKVNGRSVKLNGINYQPTKLIASQMYSDEYAEFIDKVLAENRNVIHVLGSGIYENDYFYDLADTKGILIIQDFMFTNLEYPASVEFLENVRIEADEIVNHLKQHPSLILWTGGFNNEDGHNNSLKKILEETVKKHDSFHSYLNYFPTDSWKSN